MKKILLIGMLVISGLSFAKDYTYNEMRDIVLPAQEQYVRLSRESSQEWLQDKKVAEKNFEVYSQFHNDLAKLDTGNDRIDR